MAGIGGVASWAVPGFAAERELGHGASGRVVAAVHVASGYRVAIKYLSPAYFGDPGFRAQFRAEAALLRSLADPHVVRLFDYIEAPGQGAAILMELVAGVSLHKMISEQGPTTPESALAVLKGSLLGLAAAHALGIVHRDYKPENVLVDGAGLSKLSDFGIAARAGDAASFGGTPQYMAPEQWDGSPPSPATDIYAATAVFFECLTGKTPFSGGVAQLQAAHATAAIPVEQVDEPLRELITRGMAKDPAARPADASQFMIALETTAAAAYGADWESRGRSQLAARAAALLLLLLHGSAPAAGGGTGTTTASTYLGGAAKAATRAGRVGLHGWRAATVYSTLFVAVFAAVAGGIVGVSALTGHGTSSSRSTAGGPTSGGPSSGSKKPTNTAASSPACGNSGLPALAYVTTKDSALGTTTVAVRCGTDAPRTLGTFQFLGDPSRPSLAWSPDGTRLAWLTSSALYIAQAKEGTWSLRHWACQLCGGIAFRGDQAVTVSGQATGGPFAAAIPQLLVFPASGSGQPLTVSVAGIKTFGTDTNFIVLGNISPTDLVVEYGDFGGNNGGGAQFLFRVNSAGQATQYGHATVARATSAAGTIDGRALDFRVSPDGSQLAFADGTSAGADCSIQHALLLDTATAALTTPAPPAGASPAGYLVQGMWFDRSGTPYASLVPNLSSCYGGGAPPGAVAWPANAAPIVYKLVGGAWVKAGKGVFQAAYGPGNWLAEQTGVTSAQNALAPQTLTISNAGASTPITVPGATNFAWAP